MSGRILIADDVATNRIILKVKLSAASYDVVQADSGNRVLELVQGETPDLIILATMLPDLPGTELCRRLRANPACSDTPIILVANDGDTATRLAALSSGADEIITKPIDEICLLARVRNLLRDRVMGEELKLRQGTALELGFAEAPATFARPGHVAMIADTPDIAAGWRGAVAQYLDANVIVLPKGQVLDSIGKTRVVPDVFVVSGHLGPAGSGLTMLAELRSRNETRHSSVILVHDDPSGDAAVTSLDMGANDLLPSNCDPMEMVLRIKTQLRRKRQSDRLRDTVEDGLKLAMTDPLTGLFNRRYAFPHLARIAERSAADGRPFAIMVLDMDHFKRINDRFGHSAGDQVLVQVSRQIKANMRSVDLVARIGGEEFLVVMPDTDLHSARAAAERLRRITAESPVHLPEHGTSINITLSIGVTIGNDVHPDGPPVLDLVGLADKALLGAKAEGRNQVTFDISAA